MVVEPLVAGLFTIFVGALNEVCFALRERRMRKHRLLEYVLPERIKAHTQILARIAKTGIHKGTVPSLEPKVRKNLIREVWQVSLELFEAYAPIAGGRTIITLLDIHAVCGTIIENDRFQPTQHVAKDEAAAYERLQALYHDLLKYCREESGSQAVDHALSKSIGKSWSVWVKRYSKKEKQAEGDR